MASPESTRGVLRQRLTELRNGLLHLHKILLDSETASYDRDMARIKTKGQLLELVLHDPWFAWLHELSELVVLIDKRWMKKSSLSHRRMPTASWRRRASCWLPRTR